MAVEGGLIRHIEVGYTLILLISVTFVAVALSNSYFDSTVSPDVVMGVTTFHLCSEGKCCKFMSGGLKTDSVGLSA